MVFLAPPPTNCAMRRPALENSLELFRSVEGSHILSHSSFTLNHTAREICVYVHGNTSLRIYAAQFCIIDPNCKLSNVHQKQNGKTKLL